MLTKLKIYKILNEPFGEYIEPWEQMWLTLLEKGKSQVILDNLDDFCGLIPIVSPLCRERGSILRHVCPQLDESLKNAY